MIRSSFALGRYAAAEYDAVFGTARSFVGDQPSGVVFCHGSGENAASTIDANVPRALCSGIARHATVHAGDLGGQTWGNDTGIARVVSAGASVHTLWGAIGPVGLVAASMGFATACAYALANPDEVAWIAGVIPLTDIQDIMGRGAAAEVDAAYGGAYSNITDGPTHNPVLLAPGLPADLPVHIWTAPDDPLCVPATADAFIAARPQTGRTILSPGQAHTMAAVAEATPAMVEWAKQFTFGN